MTNYLVLTDFTNSAKNALISALNLSKKTDGNVTLLHVLESNSKEDKEAAEKKMSAFEKEVEGQFEIKITEGKLIDVISSTIDLLDIDYVIMGTHGVTGIQKLLGAKALKLVDSTKKPFLITQENKTLTEIKNIVMPFSFSSESIQIGKVAAALAKSYNAKIYLAGYRDNDEWLKNDMVRNQAVIKRAFNELEADFEIVKLEGKTSFENQLLDFSKSIDADLIAAGYFNGSRLILRKNFVRDMICNQFSIPVLTLNAECLKNVGNFASI